MQRDTKVFAVVVNCNNPVDAELLKRQNGETKTWVSLNDSEKVVDKINEREGFGSARSIVL